jgi:hypothetical protein
MRASVTRNSAFAFCRPWKKPLDPISRRTRGFASASTRRSGFKPFSIGARGRVLTSNPRVTPGTVPSKSEFRVMASV